MLQFTTGNMLEDDSEALVNTVNCVGALGKGLALQFKKAFPEIVEPYQEACESGELHPGRVQVVRLSQCVGPRFVINFPTKDHWRANSRLEDLDAGLEDLVRVVDEYDLDSIAVPPLGCGLGGLDWRDVRPLLEMHLGELDGADITAYRPGYEPEPAEMPDRTERPELTRARALFIGLIGMYRRLGYRLSRLEIQKLAYFLQLAGEPLNLRFEKSKYGPYADNLRFVLQRLDGHFIEGVGDGKSTSEIHLAEGALDEAEDYLNGNADADERLSKVASAIEGFETPYGMELLGTVHWAAVEETDEGRSIDETLEAIRDWNERKREVFDEDHVRQVYEHLKDGGWLDERIEPTGSRSTTRG